MSESAPSSLASPESRLVRGIGTFGLAAGIVNVTVGGGIFRLPSGVAATLGTSAPLAYVACTIALALIVICFAEAGSRVSMTGGPYAYVETAFGPLIGFVSGVMIWVSSTLALSAVSTFFADSLVALVPALGAMGRGVALVIVLAVLAAANARGVAKMTRFNALATVAKLLPLVLLVVVGLLRMNPSNLHSAATPTAASVSRASVLLIFAFLGVESALMPSGEIRDPARTVPRSIFLAMGVVAVLYVLIQIVAQGVLGSALAGDRTPLASAAGAMFGPAGRTMILVCSSLSMFVYLSGMTLALPRMLFAFGRDGFLPIMVASVHPTWRTPHVAIAVQCIVVAALALLANFEKLAVAANVTGLLVYGACCIAAAELQRRDVRTGGTPFEVPGGRIAPWLAVGVIGWLLWQITAQEWRAAAIVVTAALIVYAATSASRRTRAAAGATARAAS
ncbi:MAG TPA: amino acid permease [Gemmatimonadaceae bacterium]|nr:amino acid permease [Gemmatimonadaceae bacterium]